MEAIQSVTAYFCAAQVVMLTVQNDPPTLELCEKGKDQYKNYGCGMLCLFAVGVFSRTNCRALVTRDTETQLPAASRPPDVQPLSTRRLSHEIG